MPEDQNISLTVDAVIFRKDSERKVLVLLVKRKNEPFRNHWALPGGFVEDDESLIQAAKRELHEETGVKVERLDQLGAFGDPRRDPRGRVVTVAFFGRISESNSGTARAASDAKEVNWFDLNDLPSIAFDHGQILKLARKEFT